ncbi:MAG TPA: WXG100 family type VII secretion target [Eubacterium sp.]|nr:WXG100 family type VII secretion target [Eubacterium sp.]
MGMGKIVVSTEQLMTASRDVNDKASEYKSEYDKLYNLVTELQNVWSGIDNVAYTNQINEFRNDFEIMRNLMVEYATFLSDSANKYRETQSEIEAKAKSLSTGV